MPDPSIKMIITDLDGTLLSSNSIISEKDWQTLLKIKQKGIITVIATGRSIFSLDKTIPKNLPIDYIIFSSGAGILDWKRDEIIHSNKLEEEEVSHIVDVLTKENFDFMIQFPIPQNHHFVYYLHNDDNRDFLRRCQLYNEYATKICFDPKNFAAASQIISITKDHPPHYHFLKEKFTDYKVIRATSPLDNRSLWVEIFPRKVSKGDSLKWLCHKLQIKQEETVGIGNDFNDIDFLDWTEYSYVVENAHKELHKKYKTVSSNDCNGFSQAVEEAMNNY